MADAGDTPPRPVFVRAELLSDEGPARELPLEELEQLERDRDQDVLENVVVTLADGRRMRPYRFGSVAPVELDGETIIL